jgi:hypothetical protein
MIYFNNEMKIADQLCKKLGIKGHRIFIDSKGAMAVSFKTEAHRQKYQEADIKRMEALGYTGTVNTDPDSPLEDWEKNLFNEMEAVRH